MQIRFDVWYYSQAPGQPRRPHHKYSETWRKERVYCPRCASGLVWANVGDGDYYMGAQHLCMTCGGTFYLPEGVRDAKGEQNVQRQAHIAWGASEAR